MMDHVIIVRQGKDPYADELLKISITSQVNYAFITFLFKEIILQAMIMLFAIIFIFFGLPIGWCLSTIPIVAFFVYMYTYSYHAMKAAELTSIEPMNCWIAEAYEPYFMSTDPCDINYEVFNNSENIENITDSKLRKKVIGVVYIRDFFGPMNSLWLYGLAVDPKYRRKGIGKLLVKNAYDFCRLRNYDTLELVITDLQHEARLMFLEIGFKLKQIYHKKFFEAVPLGKYQMSIPTSVSREQ